MHKKLSVSHDFIIYLLTINPKYIMFIETVIILKLFGID